MKNLEIPGSGRALVYSSSVSESTSDNLQMYSLIWPKTVGSGSSPTSGLQEHIRRVLASWFVACSEDFSEESECPFVAELGYSVFKVLAPRQQTIDLNPAVLPYHVTIFEQLSLRIGEICNPPQRSEDTPSLLAWSKAQKILNQANKSVPITLDATVVEASEGDLLIHWDTPTKNIVLICPKNSLSPSIYKESLQGLSPINSELISDASPELLSEALAWVQSRTL